MASATAPASKTTPKTTAGRHRKPDRSEQNARGAVAVGQAVAPKRPGASVTKGAAAGAASGAATGATVGSLIPGIGTAVGAGAGAVVGGAAGANGARKEKKAARSGGGNKALIAEFVLCMVVLGLSPLSKPDGAMAPAAWMKRATAICGTFIVLGLVSSVGPRTARTAAGFGALVTLALVIDQRSIFAVVASGFKDGNGPQTTTTPPAGPPPDSTIDPWGSWTT